MKIKNILIIVIYSGLFLVTSFFGSGINYLDLSFFVAGIVMGMGLMYFDESFFYKYYLEPKTKSSNDNSEVKLVTRSLLFIISLLPLGLFIITSTGSELGVGLFLGIITMLLLELVEYKTNIDLFHSRFLSQLKRKLSSKEIETFIAGFGLFTFIFILLIFFL